MSNENLTLLTDFYELTMMQGYFKNQTNPTVVFDMFYRVNQITADMQSLWSGTAYRLYQGTSFQL